jgi:IclR family pca regulon transcriptional regulator
VTTLVTQGDLQRDASRRYRLGPDTIKLGMATYSALGLCTHARPHLEVLARRTSYTSEIAVLDGPAILLLDSVTMRRRQARTGPSTGAGSRLPAHCTSMGKVLLAHLPEQPRQRLIAEMELTQHGPNTITSRPKLSEQLEQVRRESLAVNDEERVAGTCAIAAPIRDGEHDVVAAINVVAQGGELDVDALLHWFGTQLIATAARITKQLGG